MAARQRKTPADFKDPLVDGATEIEKKFEDTLIGSWNDLPLWLRDNHFILTGYRSPTSSYVESFSSLRYLHNESVNVYSHLLGAIAFAVTSVVSFNVLGSRYQTASKGDAVAFGAFFLGAIFCLAISATFHAVCNHSVEVLSFMNKLDYVGIVLLITGSFVPSIYYGFYCEPLLQIVYWTMVSSLGTGCAIVSITPKFRTSAWRPYRAAMFVMFGLSAIFPVLHGLKLYGVSRMRGQMGLYWVILQGLLYVLGAAMYATRVPERIKPGAFDIIGSSHQIFHVLVVMAVAAHLIGLVKAFNYNHGERGGRC
ncbi:MAG: hypothetical protein M1812_006528 [Candelaria pacifica]|nr:MAG: hypothetical protein M1812_006528 [Candelaria pacifica]